MNFEKSLAQLGEEYENAAEILSERIRAARQKLASLNNRKLGKEAYRLKSELKTLYSERREAFEIAAQLCGYYGETKERKPA